MYYTNTNIEEQICDLQKQLVEIGLTSLPPVAAVDTFMLIWELIQKGNKNYE